MALDHKRKEKNCALLHVPYENVISAPDVKSIYDVPLNFEKDKIGETIEKSFGLPKHSANLSKMEKVRV